MNLISGTHHSCERREYVFMILREYTIISQGRDESDKWEARKMAVIDFGERREKGSNEY